MKIFTFICALLFLWTNFVGIYVMLVVPEVWACYQNPDDEFNVEGLRFDPVRLNLSFSFTPCE